MELLLIIAFIISNLGWLLYYDRHDKREQDERRQLFNRIAKPDLLIKDKEVAKKQIDAFTRATELSEEEKLALAQHEIEEQELAAVGQVNPTVKRIDNGTE